MKQFSINGLTLTQEDKLVLFWFKYVEETSSPSIYQSTNYLALEDARIGIEKSKGINNEVEINLY